MKNLSAFITGSIFAIGLIISTMVNPKKVKGFLNALDWDPTLAFVMGSAVITNLTLFYFIFKRKKPMLDKEFHLPSKMLIDKRLIIGSVLFGAGWGLSGLCPGPALVNIVKLDPKIIVFILIMTICLKFKRTRHHL